MGKRSALVMASKLYFGTVMHQRMMPMSYRFNNKVFGLLLDIDQIEQEIESLKWLSLNRFNLLSIHTRDHGSRDGSPWRTWVEGMLERVHPEKLGRIRLLCLPKVLGYNFNPLSVWYCENTAGQTVAIISEVRNTFGGIYHYVHHNNGDALTWPIKCEAAKRFHVSPFINMHQQYHFTFTESDERLSIVINEYENNQLHLVANLTATLQKLTNQGLLNAFFSVPLVSFKIITLIHWHALKIWLRGGKFHSYDKTNQHETKSEWIVKKSK